MVAKERTSVRRAPAPSIGVGLPPGCPVTGLVTGLLSRGIEERGAVLLGSRVLPLRLPSVRHSRNYLAQLTKARIAD